MANPVIGFYRYIVTSGASAVSSVFGRSGAVIALTGDYAVGQVTGAAPLLSPTLSGTPTAPTPPSNDNSTRLATTAFVKTVAAPLATVSTPGIVQPDGTSITISAGIISATGVTASPTFTGTVTFPDGATWGSGGINSAIIGGTTPAALTATNLTATGTVSLSPANHNITISPSGSGSVIINPATTGTLDNITIGGTTTAAGTFTIVTATSVDSVNFTATGAIKGLHFFGNGSTPGIAAGAGAGAGPTVGVTGHDLAGQISVLTGGSPGTASTIVTVSFANSFGSTPFVILSSANAAAAALTGATQVFAVAPGTTTFTLTSGASALSATTTYLWNYIVIGNN